MGPRPCGRGWPGRGRPPGEERDKLQWGHGLAAVVGPTPMAAPLPGAVLQWGHGLAAVVGRPRPPPCNENSCFNGATALRPWLVGWAIGCRARGPASMGPRPCGRGWRRWIARRPRTRQASMGPRPCGRGWFCASECLATTAPGLQWGHGLAAVVGMAAELAYDGSIWLQWGHGLAAVVGCAGPLHGRRLYGLQWGHGLAAVVGRRRSRQRRCWPASMGPRPCGRGWRVRRRRTACRPGFNGATALRPWLALPAPPRPSRHLASMGPRPCGRGWRLGGRRP